MHNFDHLMTLAKGAAAATTLAFGAFFVMDERHASQLQVLEVRQKHDMEMVHAELEALRQIKLSDSTRYAEVAKFYIDRMKDGEQLSSAEQKRLDLVLAQQERIAEALK